MMERRVLALETTGPAVSIAVAAEGVVLARADVLTRAASTELVMRLVDDVLHRTRTEAADVGRIAVTRGPGSFTGIRVGLATARGLGLGWSREVVSVTAFETLAAVAARHRGPIVVLLDARRGQIYGQAFAAGNHAPRPVGEPQVVDPGDVGCLVPVDRDRARGAPGGMDRDLLVLGNAAARYRAEIAHAFEGAVILPPAAPDAAGVVAAVELGYASTSVVPLYVRPPDARLPGPRSPA